MTGRTFDRDSLSWRERPAVAARRMKQRERRLSVAVRTTDERWPKCVDDVVRADSERRPVLGAAVENPAVAAHADRCCERSTSIAGRRERNVAEIARVHVPPRGVDRAIRACCDGSFAAVAHAAGERL